MCPAAFRVIEQEQKTRAKDKNCTSVYFESLNYLKAVAYKAATL